MIYLFFFFFFNDTATTEIYTLSLHDALPIFAAARKSVLGKQRTPSSVARGRSAPRASAATSGTRSEEHTSELQSPCNLVCRLLLEKKKKEDREIDDDSKIRNSVTIIQCCNVK